MTRAPSARDPARADRINELTLALCEELLSLPASEQLASSVDMAFLLLEFASCAIERGKETGQTPDLGKLARDLDRIARNFRALASPASPH